jgi:hypothetical protein
MIDELCSEYVDKNTVNTIIAALFKQSTFHKRDSTSAIFITDSTIQLLSILSISDLKSTHFASQFSCCVNQKLLRIIQINPL